MLCWLPALLEPMVALLPGLVVEFRCGDVARDELAVGS